MVRQSVERRGAFHVGQGTIRVPGWSEMEDRKSALNNAKQSEPSRRSHLNLTSVMSSFFGQIVSSNTPSSLASESGYCSSSLFLIPLCTDDLTAVEDDTSPFDGLKDLNSDMETSCRGGQNRASVGCWVTIEAFSKSVRYGFRSVPDREPRANYESTASPCLLTNARRVLSSTNALQSIAWAMRSGCEVGSDPILYCRHQAQVERGTSLESAHVQPLLYSLRHANAA